MRTPAAHLLLLFLVQALAANAARADDAPDGVRLRVLARNATVFLAYDYTNDATGEVRTAMGTGFLVRSDGTVLTAWHTFEAWLSQNEAERSKHPIRGRVGSINAGTEVELAYIAGDKDTDTALIGFRDGRADYPTLPVCFSEAPLGAKILAYGFPQGKELTPFPGELANNDGPGRRWSANVNFEMGTSGGPVFDARGQVIGLVYGGFGSVSSVRYITPVGRAKGYLSQIGVSEACSISPGLPGPPALPVLPLPLAAILLGSETKSLDGYEFVGSPSVPSGLPTGAILPAGGRTRLSIQATDPNRIAEVGRIALEVTRRDLPAQPNLNYTIDPTRLSGFGAAFPRRFRLILTKNGANVSYIDVRSNPAQTTADNILSGTEFPLLRFDRTSGLQETLDFVFMAADSGIYDLRFRIYMTSQGQEYSVITDHLYIVRR